MKKRILILEDDQSSILLYNKLLHEYELTIASNIPDAMMLIDNNKPFDAYIFDIHIKGSKYNGTDLLDKVNRDKAVIVSAINLFGIHNEHPKIKGVTVYQKPFVGLQLKEDLKKIVNENYSR
jgi:DNA-binding NtrC family response regulator